LKTLDFIRITKVFQTKIRTRDSTRARKAQPLRL
jgi:hypothetical protein